MSFGGERSSFEYLKRGIAAIVCITLILGVLFSAFYIAHEYEHDCTGEDCPICQYIAECEAFVNQISTGIVFLFTAIAIVSLAIKLIEELSEVFSYDTLVSQKVRLNN